MIDIDEILADELDLPVKLALLCQATNIIFHLEIYDDASRAEPRAMPRILISDFTGDPGAADALP